MKARNLLFLLILSLTGCAQIGKQDYTKFESFKSPTGQQQFKYVAHGDIFHKDTDPQTEISRMQWLQMWLDDNKLCPNGYIILERNLVNNGYYESINSAYYLGQCK